MFFLDCRDKVSFEGRPCFVSGLFIIPHIACIIEDARALNMHVCHTDYLPGDLEQSKDLINYAQKCFDLRSTNTESPWLQKSKEVIEFEATTATMETMKADNLKLTKALKSNKTKGKVKKGDGTKGDTVNVNCFATSCTLCAKRFSRCAVRILQFLLLWCLAPFTNFPPQHVLITFKIIDERMFNDIHDVGECFKVFDVMKVPSTSFL